MNFTTIKFLHVMSAVVLLGTGLGLAFMLFRAQQSRDSRTLLFALNNILIGDIVFIGPALFVLFGSGHWMLRNGGHSVREPWMIASLALIMLVGLCWFVAVFLEWRMRNNLRQVVADGIELPPRHKLFHRLWMSMGAVAFLSALAILVMMVIKPSFSG
ncbi:DUF2269 family protein [Nitrospina watsonii]|uniref:DUF2269 domain-containing protein n=1 Tax=Nitrospina watsonii TaxID=1323948 RepID=A0ABN8VYE2_9BACT|nr:DUF2269 domain-containing protein [Nitrospina watsonii]CAI2718762.1 conserved membrane protein of unknown function [Nitrospina watsonii]